MGGYFTNGSNWLQLRPPKTRISYFVCRISRENKQREKNVGLEAESKTSGGWKMSAVNDSETGRLRRRSDSDGGEGVPVPSPVQLIRIFVSII